MPVHKRLLRRYRTGDSGRWLAVALVGVACVALGLVAYRMQTTSASDTDAALDAAVREMEDTDGDVAAIVNGVEIPEERVAAITVFGDAYPLPEGVDANDRESIVDMLVRLELLYQEAVKRGLAPDEDTVAEFAREQAALLAVHDDPAIQPLLRAWEELGHPVDGWGSDPVLLEGYGRAMAVGALTVALGAEHDDNSGAAITAREAADALARELEEEADIVIFPAP